MTPTVEARRGRRTLPALAIAAMLIASLVAACGGTASPAPSDGATPAPTDAPTRPAPTDAPTAAPTDEPSAAPTSEPTEAPSATPSGAPGTTAPPGAAAACAGNDDNRAWFEGLAQAVAWDVYCPVLPSGWFVVTGDYRLAGGGRMEITYRGPGGQRIAIREGFYCAGQAACIPAGPDAGTASFDGLPARLVDAGGGAWLVVAADGDPGWEARGTGMDGATLAGFAAAFVRVEK